MKYIKYINTILILITLCSICNAQQVKPFKVFDKYDTVYWIGNGIDIKSSIGKKELNPILRNNQGLYSINKGLLTKSILWVSLKGLQRYYPDHRKFMQISIASIGIAFGIIGVRNTFIKQSRGDSWSRQR
jgi:hypothetical protein